jgi:hypothetical protein
VNWNVGGDTYKVRPRDLPHFSRCRIISKQIRKIREKSGKNDSSFRPFSEYKRSTSSGRCCSAVDGAFRCTDAGRLKGRSCRYSL